MRSPRRRRDAAGAGSRRRVQRRLRAGDRRQPAAARRAPARPRDRGRQPARRHAGAISEIGPRAVSRTVRMRLSRLPPEATEVARAVAILGDGHRRRGDLGALGRETERRRPGRPAPSPAPRSSAPELRSASPTRSFARPSTRTSRPASARSSTAGPRVHVRGGRARGADRRPAARLGALRRALGRRHAGDAAAKATGSGASDVAVTLLRRMLAEPIDEERRARVLLDLGLAEAKSTDGEARRRAPRRRARGARGSRPAREPPTR